ncbi:MAG: precorrin-6A synthase (deacetylating) [Myxococcota bacterium]
MERLLLVGIGTGSPSHLTTGAIDALRRADAILLPDKGPAKARLAEVRDQLLDVVFAGRSRPPLVRFIVPRRDTSAPYCEGVEAWHDALANAWTEALAGSAPDARRVAMLVWGDPSLYDSTTRVARRLRPVPHIEIIPGITALQALTTAHGITLNTVGGSVLVTTGRRLAAEGFPANAESVVVMLDGSTRFRGLVDEPGLHVWWGAYLAMPEQRLIAGPLARVSDEIVAVREQARREHGWIMDTYLIRRGEPREDVD